MNNIEQYLILKKYPENVEKKFGWKFYPLIYGAGSLMGFFLYYLVFAAVSLGGYSLEINEKNSDLTNIFIIAIFFSLGLCFSLELINYIIRVKHKYILDNTIEEVKKHKYVPGNKVVLKNEFYYFKESYKELIIKDYSDHFKCFLLTDGLKFLEVKMENLIEDYKII